MDILSIVTGMCLVIAGFFLFRGTLGTFIAVAGNPSYDALLSTTLANYRNKFTDNVSRSFYLMYWLTRADQIDKVDGGEALLEPLLYGKNTTAKSYSGYGLIDTTPQAGMTTARYPWKQLAGTVSISGLEQRQNSGKAQIIDLLASKVTQLEISLRDEMNRQFFGDSLGNNSQDMFGLQLLVEDGTAWGTLAGIDSNDTANSWWRNQFIASSAFGNVGPNANGITKMRTLYNTCSRGNEHPDFSVTDQTTFESYEQCLTPNERFEDKETGDAGFVNLKFKGLVIGYDEQCPATYLWMLNSRYIRFRVDTQRFLQPRPFQESITQDAIVSKNLTMGNLVVSNRARHGLVILT